MTEWQQYHFSYLNIIQLLNNCSLVEYWNFCFTEFSKFTYVH